MWLSSGAALCTLPCPYTFQCVVGAAELVLGGAASVHLTRACRPPSFFFFFALVATGLATAGVTRLPLFRDFGTAELVLGGPLLFIRVVPPTSPLPCPWYCLALATHRLQLTVASSRSLPPFCHRLCGCAYGTLFRVVANALARARLCRPPPSTTLCPCTFAAAALPTTFPLPPPSPPSRRRGSYLFRMYLVSRHSMLWLKEWFDSTGPGAGTSKLSSCRGPPRAYSGCLSGSVFASFGARRRCPCRPHAFFRYRRLRHRSRRRRAPRFSALPCHTSHQQATFM